MNSVQQIRVDARFGRRLKVFRNQETKSEGDRKPDTLPSGASTKRGDFSLLKSAAETNTTSHRLENSLRTANNEKKTN